MQRKELLDKLKKEAGDCCEIYKEKRKYYETRVRLFNFILSSLPVAIAVMFILSSTFANCAKICNAFGLFFSMSFIVAGYMAKNSSYDAKLIQRGTTYFALCNLLRKIRFEPEAEKKYEEFLEEYKKIMENENEMSLKNSYEITGLFRKYYQKGLEQEQNLLKNP